MNHLKLIGIPVLSAFLVSLFVVYAFTPPRGPIERIREIIREGKEGSDLGAFPGGELNGPLAFRDQVSFVPRVSATTTTGSSATLVAADIVNTQYHIVTLGGAQDTDFTYTLPASTTMYHFLPRVGERSEDICFFNTATSTSSGADLVFAGGTGVDLVVATTTRPVPLGVPEEQLACLAFTRQPTLSPTVPGDFTAVLKLYFDAD